MAIIIIIFAEVMVVNKRWPKNTGTKHISEDKKKRDMAETNQAGRNHQKWKKTQQRQ